MSSESTHIAGDKKLLFTDEVFNQLKQAQQDINEATDIIPNLRKLIACIITEDNINKAKQQLIDQYS